MKNNKPMPAWLVFALISITIIFAQCYISMQNKRAIVDTTVSELAHQADTQNQGAVFSSDSVLENYCPDVAVKLAKQGYMLSTDEKTLISFVDKAMACHDNHVITVKSK